MKVFRNILNLYSLAGVEAKAGRQVVSADLSHIENAAIVEDNGRILWVGTESELDSKASGLGVDQSTERVDLNCETLLPGFVECHTHLVHAGDRSQEFEMRNQGKSYLEISKAGGGIASTVAATSRAAEGELLSLAQKRADQFLAQGVTTLEVKSGYGLSHEGELKLLRVANKIQGPRVIPTYLGPHSIPQNMSKEQYLKEITSKTLKEVADLKLASRADIFIENGFFSKEEAKAYYQAAKDLGLELTGHVEQLSHQGGAALASEMGALSVDHVVEINRQDIQNLAKSESVCVLLPAADFYLKMAYPPARELIDAGATVAIATDFNPGSSPTQSLNFVGVLSRLNMQMTLPEVIAAYTYGPAKSLGLASEVGSLVTGKACDFVTFEAPLDELFYQIGVHPVQATYAGGQRLWSNKNITN